MRAPRRGSYSTSTGRTKRPPRIRIPRRVKPGAYERHQALFDAHALETMRRENAELEEWEGTMANDPMPGDVALMPDFRTGGLQRVGTWTNAADGPPPAISSGARRSGSSSRIAVRRLPEEPCRAYFKEKLLSDWHRDRHMVLKNLGLEHERDDPAGFSALMSTVRGQMDAARLESQLTTAVKSSGVKDPSVLRLVVDSLKGGFVPDGDLCTFDKTHPIRENKALERHLVSLAFMSCIPRSLLRDVRLRIISLWYSLSPFSRTCKP